MTDHEGIPDNAATPDRPPTLDHPLHCRVSVVIPAFNSAAVLPAAIESVLAQTLPADDVIVVDDGSTDETKSVCRRYEPRVSYVRQQNHGASSARNAGIAVARRIGPPDPKNHWLAFLDADDEWDREKLALQHRALAQNVEADFAVTAALVWSEREQTYVTARWNGSLDPNTLRAELLVRNVFTGLCSSLLIRRGAIEAVGGFASGKACEDRRIAIELLERHRGLILPHPLIRQRPGPAHWRNPERHRGEMIRLIEDYEHLYRRLDPSGGLKRRAWARMHERAGMHYLENGDLRAAARDLSRAVLLQPLMANPWRVLINAMFGRLKQQESKMQNVEFKMQHG